MAEAVSRATRTMRLPCPAMDYGLALPNIGFDANLDGLAAAVSLAEQHGFSDVWATDHLLVNHAAAEDYGRTYESITTLAWLAARTSTIRLGLSVVVAPMRNAVVLAKELATLDALSGWIGGRDERALRRVGRLADAYHASATGPAR